MAIRKIAVMGHPVLRQQATPVPEKEISKPEIQNLIQDMIQTMFEYDGRGLAAPQIHESLQIVVMIWDFDPKVKPYIQVLINPEIKALTQETSSCWEGCLSLPGLRGKVDRPNKISVQALDAHGKKISFEAEGFTATVIQHECDHLLGKLYIDKIKDLSLFGFSRECTQFLIQNEAINPE
ncbi:MAG: peptide deformylase [Deltaproteobacteria bacterium]|nr:peptide deformylase [Deltaproteobacteria bacterium]